MLHALIIGSCAADPDEAVERLSAAGYNSIFSVEQADEAVPLLGCVPLDLIMVLPDTSTRNSTDTLRHISEAAAASMIVATRDVDHALDCLGPHAELDGPVAAGAFTCLGRPAAVGFVGSQVGG